MKTPRTSKTRTPKIETRSTNVIVDPMRLASGADVIAETIAPQYALYHGDSCEVMGKLPEHSVHYSIFSPPFASLYTYSASPRDLGNVKNDAEFFAHFDHIIAGLKRVMVPGRLVSFHCMTMPTSKERDGYIGLRDFRGDLIRAFQRHGFVYHSEVCIWKDPVTAMQRTKALGLLYKTVRENASMTRQGLPDYLVTMRAPGECPREERVTHVESEYPCALWQRIASPVWDDINPSDTLQRESAREDDDERHICPLQLEVIRRAVEHWTNPGDVVLTPFGGIGSEGYIAVGGATMTGARLAKPRRAVVIELKASYYAQAVRNLKAAATTQQLSLMDRMGAVSPASGETAQPSVTFGAGGSVEE